jgi:hypothetical protein
MHRRLTTLVAAAAAAIASLALAPQSGSAATVYTYFGEAGGTQIRALGTLIRSDLTAPSHIIGNKIPASNSNTTASVNVTGLARVGAISTEVASSRAGTVDSIKASAEIANVSLLSGVIRAQALTTSATATHEGDVLNGTGDTQVLGLKVGSINVPVNVAPNTTIKVGNLASVVINEQKTTRVGDKIIQEGSALKVTLLRDRGKVPLGSTITVNPVRVAWGPSIPPKSPPVFGNAFGTLVKAHVADLQAVSGPTAYVQTPPFGNYGIPIVNTTARLRVPGVVTTGAVESISTSTSVPITADVANSNETAYINLLGGVIKASAIKVIAHANLDAGGNVTVDGSMAPLRLTIGGNTIPIDVAPNTKIEIPNVVSITVNEQVTTAKSIKVTGLHVTLLSPQGELGIGADVRVAEAYAGIY